MNMPSREEQDRIISDMLKAQSNLLNKPTKAQRQRQARIEAEQRATEETVTYVRKVPAPARQQSVQTTVTAAPEVRNNRAHEGEFMTFHNRVAANFNNKCAITGHSVPQCLQVAMISLNGNDNTANGLFLDTSLRILFERGLISINPDTMRVHFKCEHPLSEVYEGAEINTHRVKLDMEALRIHWNLFKG